MSDMPGMDVALRRMRQPACRITTIFTNHAIKERDMTWTTPAYTELRLGFEITMYIANR